MLHAVIGDVHGCADEYSRLLDELDSQFPTAKTVQLGDLIHKGPDSRACVTMTIQRVNEFVVGNHELKHLRWLDWEAKCRATGKTNPMQHVEEYGDFVLLASQVDWLRGANLFYATDNMIVVHAGFLSGMRRLPVVPGFLELDKRDQKYYRSLTMARFEDSSGRMVEMGKETPEDTWWAANYDGRFGYAIYGHQHYLVPEPVEYPHALGIDLGCVYGGALCAVIVDDGVPVETVIIPAAQQYKQPLKLEK